MADIQTIKDRVLLYINHLGIGVAQFERNCGLSNGYLNNLKRNLGSSKIEDILRAYPELSRVWLQTGEGSMIEDPEKIEVHRTNNGSVDLVLLVPVSAQGGSLNEFEVSVKDTDCEKVVSPIRGVDFAITVSGDSMAPEYPNGSRVFIKKINERAFIEWGKVYVLDTCNGVVIKILAPTEDSERIRCVSINQDPIYAPFEISLSDIYGIYRVLLCMSVK